MNCPICNKNRLAFLVGNNRVQAIEELPHIITERSMRNFKPCMKYKPGTPIFIELSKAYLLRVEFLKRKDKLIQAYKGDELETRMNDLKKDFQIRFNVQDLNIREAIGGF